MSTVSFLVFSQAINNVAGSTARVYATGTLTPVSVYSDEAGLVVLPQPLVCDWRGALPYWVSRGQTIDIVWDNGALVTIAIAADPAPTPSTVSAETTRAVAAETTEVTRATAQEAVLLADILPGAWTDLTLVGGVLVENSSGRPNPGWRLEQAGTIVRLRGGIKAPGGGFAGGTVATFPAPARPANTQIFDSVYNAIGDFTVTIASSGVLTSGAATAGLTLSFDGITYAVN